MAAESSKGSAPQGAAAAQGLHRGLAALGDDLSRSRGWAHRLYAALAVQI